MDKKGINLHTISEVQKLKREKMNLMLKLAQPTYFIVLIITIAYLFSEIEPSFPYRDVTVRRGVEFKDDYDIQAELGR